MADTQPPVLADSGNRAIAFLLDLAVVGAVVGGASRLLDPVEPAHLASRAVPAALFLAYFALVPLTPLQGTIGKRICRIKLCGRLGQRLDWRRSFLRAAAVLGWIGLGGLIGGDAMDAVLGGDGVALAWTGWLLAWAAMIFTPRGESLFDAIAGTLVVGYRAEPEAIARAEPRRAGRYSRMAGAILLCLFFGGSLGLSQYASRLRNVGSRINYALQQTQPLRERVTEFRAREGRWPSAAELGVAPWTSYPDGGGYRLQGEGCIEIGFSVLPELKGHTILLRPVPNASGTIEWKCAADAEFPKTYLTAACRP
jgi:uncharacterized RDD family membrane protein YckC